MSKSRQRGRRRRRLLSPVQKYVAIVQVLVGEMTVAERADHRGLIPLPVLRVVVRAWAMTCSQTCRAVSDAH